VPHPDFVSMSPTGRTVIVYQEDEEFSILDLLLMTEIRMDASKAQMKYCFKAIKLDQSEGNWPAGETPGRVPSWVNKSCGTRC